MAGCSQCFEIDFGCTSTRKQQQELYLLPKSSVASQIRRQRAGISERHLTEKQLIELKVAMDREMDKYIRNHMIERIVYENEIPVSQFMKMRWVITLKEFPDGNTKVKARLYLPGFQDSSLEDDAQNCATPTSSWRARLAFLSSCISQSFRIQKADVTATFWPGDELEETKHCIPVPELCRAFDRPSGTPAKVKKGIYGLLKRPKLDAEHGKKRFRQDGWSQCHLRLCTLKLCDHSKGDITNSSRPRSVGLLSFRVDDFRPRGETSNDEWLAVRESLCQAWQWSDWKADDFKGAGICPTQRPCGTNHLDQSAYLHEVEAISMTPLRRRELNAKVSEDERSQLRGVFGTLLWPITQNSPRLAASVSCSQSCVSTATVATFIAANRLLQQAKLDASFIIVFAQDLREAPKIGGWSDASRANRVDESLTEGFAIGLCLRQILDSDEEDVGLQYWTAQRLRGVCKSSLTCEVQALANAKQELQVCITRMSRDWPGPDDRYLPAVGK